MIRYILIIVVLLTATGAIAQQSPMYTQYMFNTVTVNPAYAASMQNFQAMLLARAQWINIDGAPTTETFTIHGPIKKEKIGVGLSIVNDKIGPISEVGLVGDFAYQIKLNNDAFLSMGLKGGFNFYQAELSKLKVFDEGDPGFSDDVKGKFMPNVGFGFYYYTNKYYLGVSAPKLMRNKFLENYNVKSVSLGKEERHYYFIGGYIFEIDRNIVFKPSVLAKFVSGAPISFDVNGSFLFYKRLWLGATYRVGDAVSLMAEVKIGNNLLLGYAFDYTLSKLTQFNSGTHEILISYSFRLSRSRLKSPRYF